MHLTAIRRAKLAPLFERYLGILKTGGDFPLPELVENIGSDLGRELLDEIDFLGDLAKDREFGPVGVRGLEQCYRGPGLSEHAKVKLAKIYGVRSYEHSDTVTARQQYWREAFANLDHKSGLGGPPESVAKLPTGKKKSYRDA